MGVTLLPEDELVRTLILSVLAWGLLWSIVAVVLRNRLTTRGAWTGWFAIVFAGTTLLTFNVAASFRDLGTPWFTWFYMGFALIGIPSAAALIAARQIGRNGRTRSTGFRIGIAVATFVLALPVAAVVSALPEFFTFMASSGTAAPH